MVYSRSFNSVILEKNENEFFVNTLVEEKDCFKIYSHDKTTNETDSYKFNTLDKAIKHFKEEN